MLFRSAFEKFNDLRDKEKFEHWITVIACNYAKAKYNKKKKELLFYDDEKFIALKDTRRF